MKFIKLFCVICLLTLVLSLQTLVEAKSKNIISYKDSDDTVYFKTETDYKDYDYLTTLSFVKVTSKTGESKYWLATNTALTSIPIDNQISKNAILNIDTEKFPIYQVPAWNKDHDFVFRNKLKFFAVLNVPGQHYLVAHQMPLSIFEVSSDLFNRIISTNDLNKTFLIFTLEMNQAKYRTRVKPDLFKELSEMKDLKYEDFDTYKLEMQEYKTEEKIPFL